MNNLLDILNKSVSYLEKKNIKNARLVAEGIISEVMGMENGQIVLQDIFSYQPSKYRDNNGKILGEFISHGLLTRSIVYQNAQVFNLSNELQSIFGG